ncbi:MAG: sulfate transporter permease subunit CysT [Verrucomicrobiota bacterium]
MPASLTSAARRPRSILPGFGLSLGITLHYLGIIVLFPLAMVFVKTSGLGFRGLWEALCTSRVFAAFRLTFGLSALAGLINCVCGFLVAWVLVRYRFPGRRFLEASVDLPFAMPTAVAGIALTALYAPNGWIGQYFKLVGLKVAFAPPGILIALTFIGLPFVVRTLQPVLEDLDASQEEAAASLGATRWQTFRRVVFPPLVPALITGSTLAFARAVGEYGSVMFIAGNMPGKTEIVPLLIVTKLEQNDYAGATALAALMLVISFVLLLTINFLQRWRVSRPRP